MQTKKLRILLVFIITLLFILINELNVKAFSLEDFNNIVKNNTLDKIEYK